MAGEITTQDLEKLVVDPDFLRLCEEERWTNLFNTVAASNTEMWHSAFVKWVLDPKSHLGLAGFLFKRFLHAVLRDGETGGTTPEAYSDEEALVLSFSDIERLDLRDMVFNTEFKADGLVSPAGGGKARLDVYGYSTTEGDNLPPLQIVVENKIYAREHADQTVSCYRWAKDRDFERLVYVFLMPDEEQMPQYPAFVQLTYQRFCDRCSQPSGSILPSPRRAAA
jgi:hypothetical protein